MKNLKLFLIFSFVAAYLPAQDNKCLIEINDQIWANFTDSFETLDYELFGSLHAEDFIRASGGSKSLQSKSSYIDGYESRWENSSMKQTISFRFLERFCDNERASERGIYQLTIYPGTEKERSFYGKFHVILVKSNDAWKILIDYDSDEGNTINKTSYDEAFSIDDFERY